MSFSERLKVFAACNLLSTMQGVCVGDWWRELCRNRFMIHPRYWPRAGIISVSSLVNSYFASSVEKKFGSAIEATAVEKPIFILGHWRSGTTLLQRLFAEDKRYCFPTFYESVFPRGFVLTEKRNSARYSKALPANRMFDNMSNGFHAPAEDEFGISTMTGLSPCMGWCFPRNADFYQRYLTFKNATPAERELWKKTLRKYIQRIVYYHGKPVVLKSPGHTARVKLILEVFPDARFVHIHRDPITVFLSTKKMLVTFHQTCQLQNLDVSKLEDQIIKNYQEMHDAFLADTKDLPANRFVDIGFDTLEKNQLETMRQIYHQLELPDFSVAEPAIVEHLKSIKDYQKNKYQEIDPALRAKLKTAWQPYFDHWGYPV